MPAQDFTGPQPYRTYQTEKIETPKVNAEQSMVNPDETTSGIMGSLLQQDSPYLQRARTDALQTMNAKGLLNSSMTAGAATSAAIGAAMPIAQNDAGIYAQTRLDNTRARNLTNDSNANRELDATRFNADSTNQLGRADFAASLQGTRDAAQQGYDLERMGKSFDYNSQTLDKQNANSMALNAQKFGFDTQIVDLQRRAGKDSAALSGAMNTINAGADNINRIIADPNISNDPQPITEANPTGASAKQQLIDKIKQTTLSTAQIFYDISGLSLADLYTGGTTSANPTLPNVGDVVDGYTYNGGDPQSPASWTRN